MKGEWLRRTRSDTVIIFVHGFLSDGNSCWTNHNGCYWPQLVSKDLSLTSVGIYIFTYNSNMFSGSYSLSDIVDALKEFILLDGVMENSNLIFICHSMGGIVARKLIVERAADYIDNRSKIALFLIASPSLGSSYANWLAPLAKVLGNKQADVLRFISSNAWLQALDKEFLNLKESKRLSIIGKEIVEDKFVVLRKLIFKQIVPPLSGARYFGEPIKIPNTDHFSISKPGDESAFQHRILLRFLKEIESEWKPKAALSQKPPATKSKHLESSVVNNEIGRLWRNPIDGTILVRIPATTFIQGADPKRLAEYGYSANIDCPPEWDSHQVNLSEFWISRTPITCSQYLTFCRETGYPLPARVSDPNFNGDNNPIIGVSWHDAQAYLKWAKMSLPTESQWERAAAYIDNRLFAWGNSPPDINRCNYHRLNQGTTASNSLIDGISPDGILDLSGNVLEWCLDDTRTYAPEICNDPSGSQISTHAAIRGGSFARSPNQCRASYRDRRRRIDSWGSTGFRPVIASPWGDDNE